MTRSADDGPAGVGPPDPEPAPVVTALYVPGDRPDRFDKAVAAGPDAVIIDLEDAVAPGAKADARAAVARYLSAGGRAPQVQVRVNARETPWWSDDLAALRDLPGLDGLRLPKVGSPRDVAEAAARAPGVAVHALVETAAGVQGLADIAASGVVSLGLGEADLAADLGIDDEQAMDQIRVRLVIAARAAGLPAPMMSVFTAIADDAGLLRSCRRGRRRGFLGRAAIHPRQIPVIRSAFTPTDREVGRAESILAALDDSGAPAGSYGSRDPAGPPGARGPVRHGVAVLADGSMVDAAMLRGARRTLALARHLRRSV